MLDETMILMLTAASIGFFHTLFGPDHYVPFIVMAKAKKWSYLKTIFITVICGLGHVGSSIILGLLGIFLGLAVSQLEVVESIRGDWAAWALIAFGLMYFVYGIRQAIRNKPHQHFHAHSDGHLHAHKHQHQGEHVHVHEENSQSLLKKPVPWALFIIFVLGPCEPLIPILMYPAAKQSVKLMFLVAGIFSLTTILTMLSAVLFMTFGVNLVSFKKAERYVHAISGLAILLCGCAIQFLGL